MRYISRSFLKIQNRSITSICYRCNLRGYIYYELGYCHDYDDDYDESLDEADYYSYDESFFDPKYRIAKIDMISFYSKQNRRNKIIDSLLSIEEQDNITRIEDFLTNKIEL